MLALASNKLELTDQHFSGNRLKFLEVIYQSLLSEWSQTDDIFSGSTQADNYPVPSKLTQSCLQNRNSWDKLQPEKIQL